MTINLRSDQNPRYTIWRALFPDAMLYELTIWIRAEWDAFFKERGLPKNEPVTSHQAEFDEWLFARHGAAR